MTDETTHYPASWIWTNQTEGRENWTTIQTKYGNTIYIPPRRYIIKMIATDTPLNSNELYDKLIQIIINNHHYRDHPEPLNKLVSHLQILTQNNYQELYIHLTNISSQKIRKTLITSLLTQLSTHYQITMTIIQLENENNNYTAIATSTIPETIETILTSTKTNILQRVNLINPPWKFVSIEVLTHIATDQEQAALPPHLNKTPVQKRKTNPHAVKENVQKHKRQTDTWENAPQPILDEDYSIPSPNLLIEALTLAETANTTHLPSLNVTPEDFLPTQTNAPPSSDLTTETTGTYFTQQQQRVMPTDSLDAFVNTCTPSLQALQRALQVNNASGTSGNSWTIAAVTVSAQSVDLDIKLTVKLQTS